MQSALPVDKYRVYRSHVVDSDTGEVMATVETASNRAHILSRMCEYMNLDQWLDNDPELDKKALEALIGMSPIEYMKPVGGVM